MKKIACILACLLMFTLGACSATSASATKEQTWPLKIWYQNYNGGANTWRLVDEDTGVNYICVDIYGNGIAITPRLNTDGSLYIS